MMKFKGQKPDEKIVFIVKKHPAVLFRPILYLTLLTLLPIAAFVFFKFSWVFSYAFFLWLVVAGAYGFNVWYSFSKTQYILTNMRLVCFEQKNLFYKHALEIPLSKIKNVHAKVKGFWPSMWDFGTIYIEEKAVINHIEEPRKIQEQIMEKVGGAEGVGGVDEEEGEELIKEPAEEEEKESKKKKSLDGPRKTKEDFWD